MKFVIKKNNKFKVIYNFILINFITKKPIYLIYTINEVIKILIIDNYKVFI